MRFWKSCKRSCRRAQLTAGPSGFGTMEKYISGSDPGAALMENPKNKLEVIECPEEEPGEFILQKYCKRETRAKYRYGVSYAQFLGKCQETVLNDRYVGCRIFQTRR